MVSEVITLKYSASDGKKFKTAHEAELHEVMLKNPHIREFAEKYFLTKEGAARVNPHLGSAIRAIALWIMYDGGAIPAKSDTEE